MVLPLRSAKSGQEPPGEAGEMRRGHEPRPLEHGVPGQREGDGERRDGPQAPVQQAERQEMRHPQQRMAVTQSEEMIFKNWKSKMWHWKMHLCKL